MGRAKPKNRRVVITGLGVVSSIGIGWEEFWKNLIAGKSGISRISSFDTSDYDNHYAGEVKSFSPEHFFSNGFHRKLGKTSQFAIAATTMALADAKITKENLEKSRSGVIIGTTMGEAQTLEVINRTIFNNGSNLSEELILRYPANMLSNSVGNFLGVHGSNVVFSNACAAGNYSIGHAFDLIKNNKADIMIAGGVDSFSRLNITGFNRLFAVAPRKCQPFDRTRKGMLVGEGAGVLILESLEGALKRKAKIYAEMLGYSLSCDAHHMTVPSANGIKKCMQKALKDAKLSIEDVDYICAHGTGTKMNDQVESKAIIELFGKKGTVVPVSSIKSMLGHTMGAASAIETIACCLAVNNDKIPPTINYKNKDEECLIDCVPNKARNAKLNVVMNNSFAFGGNNASTVLQKF